MFSLTMCPSVGWMHQFYIAVVHFECSVLCIFFFFFKSKTWYWLVQ
jgi:hypothetical protein